MDDDASTRESVAELLRACGFASRTFASAAALLTALNSGIPDSLIIDVEMPEMSGLELLRELSRRGIAVRTVVITGNDSDRHRQQSRRLGAVAYLVKPVGRDALLAAIS